MMQLDQEQKQSFIQTEMKQSYLAVSACALKPAHLSRRNALFFMLMNTISDFV